MKYVIYLIGICLITLSCKKDKLEGDMSILIGKWNWTHTDHLYGICDGDSFSETLTPLSEDKTFSLEFYEKGVVKFLENDEQIESFRTVFANNTDDCGGTYLDDISFDISLNNKKGDLHYMYGCVGPNLLVVVQGFPFNSFEKGCEFYTSYFVKE
jgi:hypothetical protein